MWRFVNRFFEKNFNKVIDYYYLKKKKIIVIIIIIIIIIIITIIIIATTLHYTQWYCLTQLKSTSTRSIEGKQHYSVHDQDYILPVHLVIELKYARIPGICYHRRTSWKFSLISNYQILINVFPSGFLSLAFVSYLNKLLFWHFLKFDSHLKATLKYDLKFHSYLKVL